MFTLLYTTGMRVGEALAIEVDDLDLTPDDEHVTVLGKAAEGAPSCSTTQPWSPRCGAT